MKIQTHKNELWMLALLILACLAVYYPAFGNDFIYLWDDQWQVLTETTENGFTLDNLRVMFLEPFHGQYFPVNQFLYTLVYELSGGDYSPFAFHLFCILLHVLNTLLVYFLFRRMLEASGRMDVSRIPAVSFITALLFAVHPLNVESVAWISASKILVYALFYLSALYTYIIYVEKRKIRYYLYSLFLMVLSFGGKEQAVILPVCILVVDWLLKRNFKDVELWIEKIPFFVLAFLLGLITIYCAHGGFTFGGEDGYPLWQRVIFGCYSFAEYLFKWLVPVKLLYLYPFPSLPGEALPTWMLSYPMLLVIIGVCFHRQLSAWPVAFGLLFFIVNIVMTLHIIPMPRFAIVADRYIYLSSAGMSFIFGYYLVEACIRWKRYKPWLIGLTIAYVCYLTVYANIRTRVWHDSKTLKREVKDLLDQRNGIDWEDQNNNEETVDSIIKQKEIVGKDSLLVTFKTLKPVVKDLLDERSGIDLDEKYLTNDKVVVKDSIK